MNQVTIEIPGRPSPFNWRGSADGRRRYSPKPQRLHMKLVSDCAMVAMHEAGLRPFTGPVVGELTFYLPIPKSWPKYKREAMEGALHTQTPDLTNCRKLLEDACSGIVYVDDQQIAGYEGDWKRWSSNPRTVITFREIET